MWMKTRRWNGFKMGMNCSWWVQDRTTTIWGRVWMKVGNCMQNFVAVLKPMTPNKAFSLHIFTENEIFSHLQRSQTGDRWKCRETRRCPLSKKGRGAMYSKHSIHNIQYIVHVMLHACHTVQHTYIHVSYFTCTGGRTRSHNGTNFLEPVLVLGFFRVILCLLSR